MGDSFNPHEILSRLRAKPIINGSTGNGSVSTSISAQGTATNASANNQSQLNNAKTTSKAIKTPVQLTLTPTQVSE